MISHFFVRIIAANLYRFLLGNNQSKDLHLGKGADELKINRIKRHRIGRKNTWNVFFMVLDLN